MNGQLLAAALLGLGLTWFAGFAVGELVKRVKDNIPVPPPSEALRESWRHLTGDPKSDKSGAWLGDMERVLFFLSFWFSAQEVVAAWLAFKVAAKWEAWSNVGALPPSLTGTEELPYLIARRRWASQRLMSFLVGALANVLVAFASAAAAKHVFFPLIQRCLS